MRTSVLGIPHFYDLLRVAENTKAAAQVPLHIRHFAMYVCPDVRRPVAVIGHAL